MTRSIIKLVAYDVPTVYHQHYADLKDRARWCDGTLVQSKHHTYLNLYATPDDERWSSCIEIDHVNFIVHNRELVYDNPHTGVF